MDFSQYHKEMQTIDLVKANFQALLYFAFFTVLFATPYLLIWGFNSIDLILVDFRLLTISGPVIGILFGIALHELVHGLFFARYAKQGFRSVKFGVMWKMLTPYAHCKEPLLVKHYIKALLAPLILVGIIPALVGIVLGNAPLLIFGIILSGSSAGDLMIYNLIRKEDPEDYVQDHPSEAGYWMYRKKTGIN